MKQKIIAAMPFLTMPIFIPLYIIMDNLFLVEIFGCGCVPSVQTNMLNIPFNANDLRAVVFATLTIALTIGSMMISKSFHRKSSKWVYCFAAFGANVMLCLWVVSAFMWK